MKKGTLLCAMFLLACSAFCQLNLTGSITDKLTGLPLAGASISLEGKENTLSGNDGRFSVSCIKNGKLTISFVGYQPYSFVITGCDQPLEVALQPANEYLDNVEITATTTRNKSLLYVPASINKLSRAELTRGNGLFLDDAIQTNIPGMQMNRRTVAGGQQFNIRGYGNGARGTRGLSSNFDGQGYKLYLNGMPVTDAEGITTFDDLDFASIGNIEVTKGPAGTLYGLAIAGAVNMSTVRPEAGKTSIGQDLMVGSYGLRRYTTQFRMGRERSSLLLNYGRQQTDGYSWHNKSHKDFVNFVGDFRPNDKQSVTTYAGYSNSYDQRFGELTLAQWANNDYSGNPDYLKRDAHSNVITFRAGLGHTYRFSKNIANTTTVFGTGFTSNASSAGGWTDKSTINYGLRSTFDTRFSAGKASFSGITGIEMQRQDAQVIGYSMKADPNDPTPAVYTHGVSPYWVINASTSNVAYVSKTSSLFTQWTLDLPKDLSVTAGIGVSGMKIDLNDRFNTPLATRPNRYKKSYTGMASPTLSVNKVFRKQFSVYASYTKAYKAPVSSYFYITTPAVTTPATPATGRVNETLEPEIGNQFELGSKGQLLHNRLVYELALFNAVFSNKMTAVAVQSPASPNTTLYSYMVNGGKQLHKGIEALVKYAVIQNHDGFFHTVRPFANLTYSDFKYGDNFTFKRGVAAGDTLNYSNKMVAAVPKIAANWGVDLQLKYGLYANLTHNYKGRVAITSLNDTWATGYNLLNAKLGWQGELGKHWEMDIYAGGQNLTNTKYYLMVFANQLPDAYIPAPKKANLFAGVNLKYNL